MFCICIFRKYVYPGFFFSKIQYTFREKWIKHIKQAKLFRNKTSSRHVYNHIIVTEKPRVSQNPFRSGKDQERWISLDENWNKQLHDIVKDILILQQKDKYNETFFLLFLNIKIREIVKKIVYFCQQWKLYSQKNNF